MRCSNLSTLFDNSELLMVEFLNRRRHLERLSTMFTEIENKEGCIVVASGRPGVGKSALLKQAASPVASQYCYVFCDRGSMSRGLPGGLPLPELLQRSLSELAMGSGFPTFDKFCSERQQSSMLGRGAEALGSVVTKSLLPGLAADFALETYSQVKSTFGSGINKSLAGITLDERRLMYSLEVFRTTTAIVHIDHAQLLDDVELDTLLHLYDHTNLTLFLEYTVDGAFNVEALPAKLHGRRMLVLAVEQLEDEYADRLFATLPDRFASALRTQFIRSGDLRPFDEALSIRSREPGILDVFDITEDNLVRMTRSALETLTSADRDFLLAVSTHAGPVDRALLSEFMKSVAALQTFNCPLDIDDAIDRLEDRLLLIPTATDVMCQTRVNKVIDLEPQLAAANIGIRKTWRDFYRDLSTLQIFVSDEDRCRQLLHQCAQLNDLVGISRTLNEVGAKGIASRNPRSIVTYLKTVVEKLQLQGEKDAIGRIALSQAAFFYDAGWFDEALACLSIVERRSTRDQYFLAELYCATGRQMQGIRLADNYLSQLEPNAPGSLDAELCLRLIRLHGLRSSNRLVESREYYLRTVRDTRFATLAGYPTLLRYADLCLYRDEDQTDCIKHLRRSIQLAREKKQTIVQASACISLMQQLGYTEAFDESENLLNEAEIASQSIWWQHAMLLNNRAVLSIYRGTMEPQSIDLLGQALVLSYDPLDRILIQTNMVVWYATLGKLEEAIRLAKLLRRGIEDVLLDTEIRRIALYNLEQLDRQSGDNDRADQTFGEWSALDSGIDEKYWTFRRERRVAAPQASRRYHMTFHPVYLAHWHTGLVPLEAVVN